MTPWLTIVGIGEDGWDGLSAKSRHAIQSAEHVIGSTRTLSMLPEGKAKHHEWPQPFSAIVDNIKLMRDQPTVMLATGDPMNYGVARKIFEIIPREEVEVLPNLSAFTLAAAHKGWSLPDCDCLTIHGRPVNNLEIFVAPDAKLLVLTQDETSIAEACNRLVARGFGGSEVTVLENLGGRHEKATTFKASTPPSQSWSALNTLAIHCVASPGAKIWSRIAGLPDEAFEHDGQMTKREVRAATLAALAPAPDQILWDIGAGCGSIAIEWCRSTRGCSAFAVEPNPERRAMIARNAEQLGAPKLWIFNGTAPDAYAGLPQPDAIFIGGGVSDEGVFDGAWAKLKTGGNLVANTVTLEGDAKLIELQKQHGGDLVRMDVSTLTNVGEMRALRPRMSVLQWRVTKP
jgi:precorrin-6B C5,15-methyltransferase / cobalt-precorrin-6B C5,C15-methyltransferase